MTYLEVHLGCVRHFACLDINPSFSSQPQVGETDHSILCPPFVSVSCLLRFLSRTGLVLTDYQNAVFLSLLLYNMSKWYERSLTVHSVLYVRGWGRA